MLRNLLEKDNFAAQAGVEILEIKEGYAKARMLVTEKHLNAGGVCQGGAIFTLADLAFAAVANSHNQLTFSLSTNITFIKSVSSGYIYAVATEIFNHKRNPFIEVRIFDENDNLLSVCTSTGYRKNITLDAF